jgi:uncharacterized phage-like protein YoqJ
MKVTATGHRPQLLSPRNDVVRPFSERHQWLLRTAAHRSLAHLQTIEPIDEVITGGALGWDWAVAEAAYQLHLPYSVYIPHAEHGSRWPEQTVLAYESLLHHAAKIVQCSTQPYAGYLLMRRNRRMLDAGQRVLALWDGRTAGGTYHAVQYARQQQRAVSNAWKLYQHLYQQQVDIYETRCHWCQTSPANADPSIPCETCQADNIKRLPRGHRHWDNSFLRGSERSELFYWPDIEPAT